MDNANTIIMQEAKMEELQTRYASLFNRYSRLLELAKNYVPEEMLKKVVNDAGTQ